MKFLFNMMNHNKMGQRSLEDVIGIMGHQMRALGHEAIWETSNDKLLPGDMGINVIVEGFTPSSVAVIAEAHAQGARFLILATEEPGPKGFNQGTQPEMVKRQEIFPEAAKFCEGIIALVPGDHVTGWFRQFAPAAYCELGYARSLERRHYGEPEYDFGFYGSMTKRRLKILKRLAIVSGSAKAVKLMTDFKSQVERDKAMSNAKVIVQVRKFEDMGLVSSSRCNTALCIGRPVVAEPHLLSDPWDKIVRFTETIDGFMNACLMTRARWRQAHQDQMARFKTMLPPEACIGAALQQLGLGEEPRRLSA